jgi:hypothetical protein
MDSVTLDKLLLNHFGYGKVESQDDKDESGKTIMKGLVK